MESAALVMTPAHQRPRVLLWAACGTAGFLAMWCAASATSAATNAHVRVQPSTNMQIGMLAPRQRLTRSVALPGPTSYPSGSSALAAAPAVIAAPVVATAAATGWLSWLALLVSLAAAAFTFFRQQPQYEPMPVSVGSSYDLPPIVQQEEIRVGGGRIDQVAQATKDDQAKKRQMTPKQVILELQQGNARFFAGTPERPELRAIERRALIVGQAPSVCILSCSDSRVPVELLFDQGLGSVFVVRVAGNILDPVAIGSIEFSVKYLGVKVLLVMGHEGCGAVKGAMTMSADVIDQQPSNLQIVLRSIKDNLDLSKLSKIRDSRSQDREAIVVNASSQVKKLQQNPLIAERVASGTLLVCGAFYEITSGIVDFFSLDKNGLVIDV